MKNWRPMKIHEIWSPSKSEKLKNTLFAKRYVHSHLSNRTRPDATHTVVLGTCETIFKTCLDDEAPYVTYTDISETTGARTTSRRHHRRRKSDEPATDTHQRNIKNVNISLEVSSILKTSKKHDFWEVVFFTKNITIVLWFECGDDFCKTHVTKNQHYQYFIDFKGVKNRPENARAPK